MTSRLTLLIVCAALGGCGTLSPPDLPVCDGTARRPANPHGSVLTPSTLATEPDLPDPPAGGGCP